jgi:hypothetical protein
VVASGATPAEALFNADRAGSLVELEIEAIPRREAQLAIAS